jgi:hypothetical protein
MKMIAIWFGFSLVTLLIAFDQFGRGQVHNEIIGWFFLLLSVWCGLEIVHSTFSEIWRADTSRPSEDEA